MRSSVKLDNRRKKILYRGWHMGMRELDLIIGTFLDNHIETLSQTELDELEALFNIADTTLYACFCGKNENNVVVKNSMFQKILMASNNDKKTN